MIKFDVIAQLYATQNSTQKPTDLIPVEIKNPITDDPNPGPRVQERQRDSRKWVASTCMNVREI